MDPIYVTGHRNPDTFGFQPPKRIFDMYTQIRDLDFDAPPILSSAVTVGRAWTTLPASYNESKEASNS